MKVVFGIVVFLVSLGCYSSPLAQNEESASTREAAALIVRQETNYYIKCVMKSHKKNAIKDKQDAKRRGSKKECRKYLDNVRTLVSDPDFQEQIHAAISNHAAKQ